MLWEFKDSVWEQDDSLKQFVVKSISGQQVTSEISAPVDKLIEAKKHPLTGIQCEKSFFPSEFKFCPFCGVNLTDPVDASNLWIAPYGTENGFKLFPANLSENVISRDQKKNGEFFQLPPTHGHISFCSLKLGARQRLLIAVNRDVGQVWIYRPDHEKVWEAVNDRAGSSDLPSWSWASASDSLESGLCIPSDNGPAWMVFDWISGTARIDRGAGKSIGSPVRVGKYIFAPVLRGNDFSVVFRKEGEDGWTDCSGGSDSSSVLSQLTRTPAQSPCMGIPYVDEIRHIAYWSCRGGYISICAENQTDTPVWEFRKWEQDELYPATALIELGPPYKETAMPRSGFWQLCQDYDPDVKGGIFYREIKVGGSGNESLTLSVRDIIGPFITTGSAVFSWLRDYWTGIHPNYSLINDQKEIRFPLIQFGEKGPVVIAKALPVDGFNEFGNFTDLFFNNNSEQSAFVRFVIQGSGVPEIKLYADSSEFVENEKIRIRLANLADITPFIYNGAFYIYLPDKNLCFFWPMS